MNIINEKDLEKLKTIQSFLIDQVDGMSLERCEEEGNDFQWYALMELTNVLANSRTRFFDDALDLPKNRDVMQWFHDNYSGWSIRDLIEELQWRWTQEDVDCQREVWADMVWNDPEAWGEAEDFTPIQQRVNAEYALKAEARLCFERKQDELQSK